MMKRKVHLQKQYEEEEEDDVNVVFIRKTLVHPRDRIRRKTTKRLLLNFVFLGQMDKNTATIPANNYVSTYGINTNDLDGLINIIQRSYDKQNYYIYKKICELANNSFVITAEKCFDVETDAEQNEKLLKI